MKLSKSPIKAFGKFGGGRDHSPGSGSGGELGDEPLRNQEKNEKSRIE